jgi:Raf kinase inhibitor-like YbhB/YbcL family protein
MSNDVPMFVNSPDFEPFGKIPDRFTCQGENVNPTLQISQVPEGTKSLAIIVDDADAISPEGTFVHWLMWNLEPTNTTIGDNSVPHGAQQGINSSGQIGWSGPCPPGPQPHHYRFMVFALNDKLDLPQGSNKLELQKAMEGKIIEMAELVGEYEQIKTGS